MKIALAILHADPGRGGAERYTLDLATALAGRGHTVTLVTASPPPDLAAGVESVVLPFGGATRVRRFLRFSSALESLRGRRDFDVLHAMLPVLSCDVYHPHAGLAAEAVESGHRSKSTPLRRTLSRVGNRFNTRRQKFAAVERQLLQSPNPPIVLGLSDYVNRSVHRYYPNFPADRLVTLFNAVDLNRFDPTARPGAGLAVRQRLGLDEQAVVGLMMAHDFARKGLSETIAAVARVSDPRLHLLVAGRQNPSAYRREAEALGVSHRVHFAGPTDDPYAFYAASQFYVLPTRHDPCSLGVLEALAMGLPVISTVFNGACEVMIPDIHGAVLSDPTDLLALENALNGVLDPARRFSQGAACLLLRSRLSYAVHLQQLLSVYCGSGSDDGLSSSIDLDIISDPRGT